jgi:hypothetical protein
VRRGEEEIEDDEGDAEGDRDCSRRVCLGSSELSSSDDESSTFSDDR